MFRPLFLSEPLHMEYWRWYPQWTDGRYLTGRWGQGVFPQRPSPLRCPPPTRPPQAPSLLRGLGRGTHWLGHLCLGFESVCAQNSCSELCCPFSSRPGARSPLILRPRRPTRPHMADPSLGTSRSAHRDPESLLWGVIRVGEAFQAQSRRSLWMPEQRDCPPES